MVRQACCASRKGCSEVRAPYALDSSAVGAATVEALGHLHPSVIGVGGRLVTAAANGSSPHGALRLQSLDLLEAKDLRIGMTAKPALLRGC